jgi:hypothetical protein
MPSKHGMAQVPPAMQAMHCGGGAKGGPCRHGPGRPIMMTLRLPSRPESALANHDAAGQLTALYFFPLLRTRACSPYCCTWLQHTRIIRGPNPPKTTRLARMTQMTRMETVARVTLTDPLSPGQQRHCLGSPIVVLHRALPKGTSASCKHALTRA